tara:strand:- start:444 stop:791 length:348 start_codon:yes stop_codon:yes gene_type:complete
MDNKFNLIVFGEHVNNAEVLFISKEKIIFKDSNEEVFCERITDVSLKLNGYELKFKPDSLEREYKMVSVKLKIWNDNEYSNMFLLVKYISPFYIFKNKTNNQELAIHENDVDWIK